MEPGWTLFDTALGACGFAWSQAGVRRLLLPESRPEATRARLARQGTPAAPPPAIAAAIAGVAALLAGDPVRFEGTPLDLDGIEGFDRSVYDVIAGLAPGETMTYGAVAARLGDPGLARAVGGALGRNPIPVIIPCHRVVAAGGRLGGFSAPGHTATKRRLLAIESRHATPLPLFGIEA